jgi:small-conductance mechanosensitive channel
MSKQKIAERICIVFFGLLMTSFALYSVTWLAQYEFSQMLPSDSPPSFWDLNDVLSKLELSRLPLIPLFIIGVLSVIILIGFLSFAQRIVEPMFKSYPIWRHKHTQKAAIKARR